MKRYLPLFIIFSLLIQGPIFADLIYLKTGGRVEGIIEAETDETVTIAIDIGRVIYPRAQIDSISKSSAEENAKLRQRWKAEKERKEAEQEEWRRFAAEQEAKGLILYKGQWITREEYEEIKKSEEGEGKEITAGKKRRPTKSKKKVKQEKPLKLVDTVSFYDEVYRYRYRYAVRLPAKYNTKAKWPVLFMFDPGANGEDAARRFAYAADKLGWIVVGSLDSRNGPWAPIERAQEAMLRDVPRRFSVDEKRFYAGGLSGGARAAFAIAYRHPTQFKGVIACAAGLPGGHRKYGISKNVAVYLCVGKRDFNLEEAREDYGKLRLAGAEVYLHEFEGGHEWPPSYIISKALKWMAKQ